VEELEDAKINAQLDDVVHLFSEAERAMKLCDQRWLEISDNYALLLLDAVWATLLKHAADRNLDKIASQREAADRLAEARKLLRTLHGADWQRLGQRDDTGPQQAVWVRLFVLQGALAFHRGEIDDARSHFERAEKLRQKLVLGPEDDGKIAQLLSMGFGSHESRAALLACAKDQNRAVARVLKRRADRQAALDAKRQQDKLRKELRAFGKTPSGAVVNAEAVAMLESIGYARVLAAEALRRADNDADAALTLLSSAQTQDDLQLAIIAREQSAAACTDFDMHPESASSDATAVASSAAQPENGYSENEVRGDEALELSAALKENERSYEAADLTNEEFAIRVYQAAISQGR